MTMRYYSPSFRPGHGLLLFTVVLATLSALNGASQVAAAPPPPPIIRCYTSQLSLQYVSGNGAAGTIGAMFRLRNGSNVPCILRGFPGIQLLSAGKRRLPTHATWTRWYAPSQQPPRLVYLGPGQSGYFALHWNHIPGPGRSCPLAPYVAVIPPNTYHALQIHVPHPVDACGGQVVVSSVEPGRIPGF